MSEEVENEGDNFLQGLRTKTEAISLHEKPVINLVVYDEERSCVILPWMRLKFTDHNDEIFVLHFESHDITIDVAEESEEDLIPKLVAGIASWQLGIIEHSAEISITIEEAEEFDE